MYYLRIIFNIFPQKLFGIGMKMKIGDQPTYLEYSTFHMQPSTFHFHLQQDTHVSLRSLIIYGFALCKIK